jgi:hypothetical protein
MHQKLPGSFWEEEWWCDRQLPGSFLEEDVAIGSSGVRVELSKKEAKIAKMWPKYKSRIMETQKAVSNYGTYR